MNFAKNYLDTVQHVIRSRESGALKLTYDAPVFALLAHTLELQLKSALLVAGLSPKDVEAFKHNIARLYAACKERGEVSVSIEIIERKVRGRWRSHLHNARDAYLGRISVWVGSSDPEVLKDFGVLDDHTIGSELPELRQVIQWLSERHASGGSQFRYLKTGLDWHLTIKAFGLNENVPMKTVEWACEELDAALRSHFFPRATKRPGHS